MDVVEFSLYGLFIGDTMEFEFDDTGGCFNGDGVFFIDNFFHEFVLLCFQGFYLFFVLFVFQLEVLYCYVFINIFHREFVDRFKLERRSHFSWREWINSFAGILSDYWN